MGGHKAQRRYDTKVYEGTGEKKEGYKGRKARGRDGTKAEMVQDLPT